MSPGGLNCLHLYPAQLDGPHYGGPVKFSLTAPNSSVCVWVRAGRGIPEHASAPPAGDLAWVGFCSLA